jgi:hypothetical protein
MQAGPVEVVLLTTSSLDDLISLVMIEEIPNSECYLRLERKIRIFLTHFADMEDQLPRKKDLPQWVSSYNFLSLLNLPDVIRQYGPIRNIWEGGPQGEGVLRFVKPNMLNGMRRAWELSTMKTLMRKKAMEHVINTTVGTVASRQLRRGDDTKLFQDYRMDLASVDAMLRDNKKLISCIQLVDGRWGIVWIHHSSQHLVALTLSPLVLTRAGLNYYFWERNLASNPELLNGQPVAAAAILLPLQQLKLNLGDDGFITHCYAVTSEDHRSMDRLGGLNFT